MFVATVRWQYRVQPNVPTMRFACLSDESEYRELLRNPTIASVWNFDLSGGLDPAELPKSSRCAAGRRRKGAKIRRTVRDGA
ncbi:hypothetical protein L1857_26315 [Amycolatopsis thermalba]|uniref:Transposase n=1 Tax=Amycolatopsis thermalba TaxID=944492 RepID=A0ABY4P149_9PSEU|nr:MULTISPECIES: hypothetical protein [Amycolatopsis]UQS26077.1 hypothetical protein L1857_26315 [Amycolatopsis thermalba]